MSRSSIQSLSTGHLRWAMPVLLASSPAMALLYTVVSPVLPELADYLGGDPGEAALLAQLVMMVPSIGLMVGGPLTGWLVDRLGARCLLVACAGIYALTGSSGLYLDSAWSLLLSRFFLGVAAAGLGTSTLALIGESFDAQARSRIVGYQSACGALMGLLSMLLAGYLGQLAGWRLPFTFYLLGVPLLVLSLLVIPKRSVARIDQGQKSTAKSSVRSLIPLYLSFIPLYAAVFTSSTQVSFLLADNGVSKPTILSLVLAMSALANTFGAAGYGVLRKRTGGRRVFFFGVMALALGHVVLGLSGGAWVAGLGCAIAGLGAGVLTPHLFNMVLDRASENQRGRAVGVLYSALFFGSFLNPLLMAPLAAWFGRHTAVLGVGVLLTIFALFILLRRERPDQLSTPEQVPSSSVS